MERMVDRDDGTVTCVDYFNISSTYTIEAIQMCEMPEETDRIEVAGTWLEITFFSNEESGFRGMRVGYTRKY